MSEAFYSHARLYDLMFPGGGPAVDFYRADANRQGGRVLELGCGTGHKLIPIASDGHPCVGLDFSSDMLAEAQRKASERGVAVEWMQGDMRAFDLGRTFDFVFITANSLLHLHEAEDLVSCFRSVRRHLAPGARFVFDVFNPSVRLLAEADGVRRTRESLSFMDPDRGNVSVDVAEIYDAPGKFPRDVALSADSEPDFVVAPLEIRSIFPQELPLLVSLGGLRLVERFGDLVRSTTCRGFPASTLHLRVRVIEGERAQSRSSKLPDAALDAGLNPVRRSGDRLRLPELAEGDRHRRRAVAALQLQLHLVHHAACIDPQVKRG